MTIAELLAAAESQQVELADLRYTLFPGVRRHRTVALRELKAEWDTARGGTAGTPLGGERRRLTPAPDTAFLDPFCQYPTFALTCDVNDALTGQADPDDLRAVARRAEAHLLSSGAADRVEFAPVLEFFVFDQAVYEQSANAARYLVDSREGPWRRGRDEPDNLGLQPRAGAAAGSLSPADSLHNLRSEMLAVLAACGVRVAGHHHAAAAGGQTAIELLPMPLLAAADALATAKYVVRNVAARHGKVVTFMPKPVFGDEGSGLPTRLSLWSESHALFPGHAPSGLSDVGRWAVGGLLAHAPSLLALTCPTTNSFKRLVPGFTAPTRRAWAHQDFAAIVRSPRVEADRGADWLDFRAPDPACDAYLAYSAILLAVLDGIEHRTEPGDPLDAGGGIVPATGGAAGLPATLDEALRALESDHDYLRKGGVFASDFVARWVAHKWENEVQPLRQRPHPYEFCLYFDG